MRPIETKSFAKLTPPDSFGEMPKLEWLPIASLMVDPEYQREISNKGRNNIRKIAEHFNWSMFGTVVVAKLAGGFYAIVDGQHRTTAAALCAIDKVPCQIIEAQRGGQAAAFRAINGNTTRPHALQLFHAAVAAGDPEALRVAGICKRAGLTVLRSPTQLEELKPGQISFATALGKIAARFGEDVTVKSLHAVVASGSLLTGVTALGVVEVLNDHPEWLEDEDALRRAFETMDLDEMLRLARSKAAHLKGSSATEQFESLLVEALARSLKSTEQVASAAPAREPSAVKQSFGQSLAIGRDHVVYRGKRINVTPRAGILVSTLAKAKPNPVGDAFLIAKIWTVRPANAGELLESIVVGLGNLKQLGLEVRTIKGVGRQLVEVSA